MHLCLQMQCLSRKKDEEFLQFFVLFLLVGVSFFHTALSQPPFESLFLFICLVGEACVCILKTDKASSLTGATLGSLACIIKVGGVVDRERLAGDLELSSRKNAVPSSCVSIGDGGLEEEADSILEIFIKGRSNVITHESHNLSVTVLLTCYYESKPVVVVLVKDLGRVSGLIIKESSALRELLSLRRDSAHTTDVVDLSLVVSDNK